MSTVGTEPLTNFPFKLYNDLNTLEQFAMFLELDIKPSGKEFEWTLERGLMQVDKLSELQNSKAIADRLGVNYLLLFDQRELDLSLSSKLKAFHLKSITYFESKMMPGRRAAVIKVKGWGEELTDFKLPPQALIT